MKRRPSLRLPEFACEALNTEFDPPLVEALTQLDPAACPPDPRRRAALLAAISSPRARFAPLFDALAELFDLDDAALGSVFERAAAPQAWSTAPLPGLRLLHLQGGPRVEQADNGLVRLAAGGRFPVHRHLGSERVLVLEGGYRDEQSGRVYLAGDLHEMPPGSSHSYRALRECELLMAVSLSDGIEIEGLGRLPPP